MSLKESWKQYRDQRHQDRIERQHRVSILLADHHTHRQTMAAQLRDELSLFRESIAQQNRQRQADEQQFQRDLQAFCVQLQNQTQAFLQAARHRRQTHAAQLALELDVFAQTLQQHTAEFLQSTTAERAIMAAHLSQSLQTFHDTLRTSVATLRSHNQAHRAERQANIQAFLDAATQQRLALHQQMTSELATFMEDLRGDVQHYLAELAQARGDRAAHLQTELAHSRSQREASVRELFQRFADFRHDLSLFQTSLRTSVWGKTTRAAHSTDENSTGENNTGENSTSTPLTPVAPPTAIATATPIKPVLTVPPQSSRPMATSQPASQPASPASTTPTRRPSAPKIAIPTQSAQAPRPVASSSQTIAAPKATPSVRSASQPGMPAGIPEQPPVPRSAQSPIVAPAPSDLKTVAPVPSDPTPTDLTKADSIKADPQPENTMPAAPPIVDPVDCEKRVYQYLSASQGARLTEIEVALDINRFQAVDALRLLIKKGLVTQRDRVYLIHVEIT
jgi:hypothetical protein